MESTLEKAGRKLTELRIQKGYKSHETFAFDYDLPRAQYWRLEKGKVNFTIKTLIKVLSIHKLTVEEFFAGIDAHDNGSAIKSSTTKTSD
ncbi:helix-turn-helix domain-containing protein [Fulvivirgaceae bacterium PWU4]|uniref:Helix-turn-helix domain-containing protein n=1 Tax=Chryseosolibacter histidini TaxID=2782349 RepID=A0AAP2GK46_9BACT|nr:helix-turn-helix transcriptional regulator [Chryseosolibacter histidini]MBT1698664.1 helix-turn-helix domain-containing protein [Chryseosolibacter histidini]